MTTMSKAPEDMMRIQINELQGYVGLGMSKDALRLARQMLKTRPLHPQVFSEALWAILIQADRLPKWRAVVESAYKAL
jgi:hypothetical protein